MHISRSIHSATDGLPTGRHDLTSRLIPCDPSRYGMAWATSDNMKPFEIHTRLQADCHIIAKLDLSHLLLMNNALLPWFILVPETEAVELHELSREDHARLTDEIRLVSRFVEQAFEVEKLNVAAIGNIVRQMHIHIIGRRTNDFAWPGPVWGRSEREDYPADRTEELKRAFASFRAAVSERQ